MGIFKDLTFRVLLMNVYIFYVVTCVKILVPDVVRVGTSFPLTRTSPLLVYDFGYLIHKREEGFPTSRKRLKRIHQLVTLLILLVSV